MRLRSDFEYLTIPPEVWLACWDLCEAAELRNLCLVCKHFCQICQALLFRSQSVVSMVPGDDTGNAASRINRFKTIARQLASLATSPHASSVRVWIFMAPLSAADLRRFDDDDDDFQSLQDAWDGVVDNFKSTLGSYRRVTVLDLRRLHIDASLRGVLESLVLLEDLTLLECDIVCPTGTLFPLKRLQIAGCEESRTQDPVELASPDTLQNLELGGSSLSDSLLAALGNYQLPQLHHISLTLTPVITDRFFAFLGSCPQLQSIRMWYHGVFFSPVDIPTTLPASVIPGLKAFSGPSHLAGIFVSGRPVEEVKLAQPVGQTPVNDIVADLGAIFHGSIPLRSLSIGAAIKPQDRTEVFTVVASLFPALCALSVELEAETISESEYAVGSSESDESGSDEDDEFDPAKEASSDAEMAEASEHSLSRPDSPHGGQRERAEDFIPLPGFMYHWTGTSFPPPECLKPDEGCSPLTIFIDCLATGVIVLPPRLEVLRFMQPPPWMVRPEFARLDQHAAILLLERLVPSLRDIAFSEGDEGRWIRDHDMWVDQTGFDFAPPTNRRVLRLFSQVWNADGLRRAA
ncbi:hypothetical protein C8R47DRAFT_1324438 [Mycena vitilis]|nr:hypothetical protein C8R47DRAFT_1324438 [Mycena vitilis]